MKVHSNYLAAVRRCMPPCVAAVIEKLGADIKQPYLTTLVSVDPENMKAKYTAVYRILGRAEDTDIDDDISVDGISLTILPDEFPGGFELVVSDIELDWVISDDIRCAKTMSERSGVAKFVMCAAELISRAFGKLFRGRGA